MTISELRKELKSLGYKVRLTKMTWGRHATFLSNDGRDMPSIYFNEEQRQEWIKLIDYRQQNQERLHSLGALEHITGLRI
jgi:predicted HTH domain antitoxin